MISIHEESKANLVAKGWLEPFGTEKKLWLPHQVRRVEDTLENVADAMEYYTWSPALFRNQHRLNENMRLAAYVALDFDEGMELKTALEEFKNYACVIGTTRNHQKEKVVGDKFKPACDRFRVLLRLSRPVLTSGEYKATASKLIDAYKSDKSCCDPRFFFSCKDIVYIGSENGKVITSEKEPIHKSVDKKESILAYQKSLDRNPSAWKMAKSILALKNGAGFDIGRRHEAVTAAAHHLVCNVKMSPEEATDWIMPYTSKGREEVLRAALGSARKTLN